MKKNNAFNLIEIMVVLIIIGIVITILMRAVKPKLVDVDVQQLRATIYNIEKVNKQILAENTSKRSLGDNLDEYCTKFSDIVNTKEVDPCLGSKSRNSFTFSNGVNVSGLTGSWDTTSAITHMYKDVTVKTRCTFDETDGLGCSGGEYHLRIFKSEPFVIPLGDLLNSDARNNNTLRFKVIQKYEKAGDNYVQTYKVPKFKVNFHDAACFTKLSNGFLTEDEKGSLCGNNENNLEYYHYDIQILDIPNSIKAIK